MTATHDDDPAANETNSSLFIHHSLAVLIYTSRFLCVYLHIPVIFQKISLPKILLHYYVTLLYYKRMILYHTYLYWQYDLHISY